MSFLEKIWEKHPYCEVLVRWFFRRFAALFPKGKCPKKRKKHPSSSSLEQTPHDFLFREYLNEVGICKGDIVIVHSSMSRLKIFGIGPDEIIRILLDQIGPSGTLVMPVMPVYDEKENWPHFHEKQKMVLTYDVQNTLSWTGIITSKFLKIPGVIRSSFPYCSLAAIGPKSQELFSEELKSDLVFGPYSSWKKLSDAHAKVLFLGADAFHSITEIHLCEDLLGDDWPIKEWYKEQMFNLVFPDGSSRMFGVRIRKQFWSQYLCEVNCVWVLEQNHLLQKKQILDCPFAFIPDMKKLTDFEIEKTLQKRLLLFRIPHRYWSKKITS